MFPTFLITLREVIEASLIVATILGILVKSKQERSIKTVWRAVSAAFIISFFLLVVSSFLGLQVRELYKKNEAYINGILISVSALFITWAVFFLHTYFLDFKLHLIHTIKKSIESREQNGLFILVFTAVFREGFEIILFLTSIYLSLRPQEIGLGFVMGLVGGILISFSIFKATVRIPFSSVLKVSSALLILFSAGLLARGVHEFAEVGFLPELAKITFSFIPPKGVFAADMLESLFGITQQMDLIQLTVYGIYLIGMFWYVFFRGKVSVNGTTIS